MVLELGKLQKYSEGASYFPSIWPTYTNKAKYYTYIVEGSILILKKKSIYTKYV